MGIASIFALALAAMPQAQDGSGSFDMNAAADLCTTDPASVLRLDRRRGTTARYVIRTPGDAAEKADAFLRDLDPAQFRVGLQVQTEQFLLVFVETRVPAHAMEQVRGELGVLCGLARTTPIKLALFERLDERDRARAARRAEKEKNRRAEAAKRAAIEARVEHQRQMRMLPTLEELNIAVRSAWESDREMFNFADADARLGRVRDAHCVRAGKIFRCRLGITALVAGAPEYEHIDLEFFRDDNAKVQLQVPEIIVT